MYTKQNFQPLIENILSFDQKKIDVLSTIFKRHKNYILHFLCQEQLETLYSKDFPSKKENFKINTLLNYLKSCPFDNLKEYIDKMAIIFNLDKNNHLLNLKENFIPSFEPYHLKDWFFLDCLTYKNVVLLIKVLAPFEKVNG